MHIRQRLAGCGIMLEQQTAVLVESTTPEQEPHTLAPAEERANQTPGSQDAPAGGLKTGNKAGRAFPFCAASPGRAFRRQGLAADARGAGTPTPRLCAAKNSILSRRDTTVEHTGAPCQSITY